MMQAELNEKHNFLFQMIYIYQQGHTTNKHRGNIEKINYNQSKIEQFQK